MQSKRLNEQNKFIEQSKINLAKFISEKTNEWEYNLENNNMEQIKQFIKEEENEFRDKFMTQDGRGWIFKNNISAEPSIEFISSSQTQLIQKIIEMVKGENKKVIVNMLQDDEVFQDKGMDGVKGFNQALSTITSKLSELIKE